MFATLTGRKSETLTGGALVARMLREEGVDTVFGIIDGTYFGLYSSFGAVGINLITPRHETCAAHMAGAYARTTGKLGVCMASNGPGVANILPGVVVEHAEGNRVLLLTSARRTGTVDPDRGGTFQSFPQVEVTAPMTKWSCRVPSAERLPELTRKALRMCFHGRPGVVHLDVPENILNNKASFPKGAVQKPHTYRSVDPLTPSPSQVKRAADLLLAAEKPMIHSGSGVLHAGAFAELDEVATLLGAAVTTSWAARATVDERKPYSIPLIHIDLNTRVRNEADAVLILGSRLGETDWWGKAPYWRKPSEQRTVQVDIDAEAIGVNKPVEIGIVACAKAFLELLAEELTRRVAELDLPQRDAWIESLRTARAKGRAKLDKHLSDRETPLHPAHVPSACRAHFDDDAFMVIDGGNTSIWSHFFYEVRAPRSILTTFKFGMLGAGLPQAIGVKAAHPERAVFCLTGDGAMGMQVQELETAVRNQLNVIVLVLCDKQWGMVKMNQQFQLKPLKTLIKGSLGPHETINADLSETRYDKLAEAMGAHGDRISSPDELPAALDRAIASGKPAVIHVDVDPVKHMWAPGLKSFKDMHAEPKG